MIHLPATVATSSALLVFGILSTMPADAGTLPFTDIRGISSALHAPEGPPLKHASITMACNSDQRTCWVDSTYVVDLDTASKERFSLYLPTPDSLKISVGGRLTDTQVTQRNLGASPLFAGFEAVTTDFYGRVFWRSHATKDAVVRDGDQWEAEGDGWKAESGVVYSVTTTGVTGTFARGNDWGEEPGTEVPAEWLAENPLDLGAAYEASFELELPAGETTIRVQHAHLPSSVNNTSGFFRHFEHFALYDLWPLKHWRKTKAFRADVRVAHETEFGWCDRLFDDAGLVWREDTRSAEPYDLDQNVDEKIGIVTQSFTSGIPDRIYAEYEWE